MELGQYKAYDNKHNIETVCVIRNLTPKTVDVIEVASKDGVDFYTNANSRKSRTILQSDMDSAGAIKQIRSRKWN